MSYSDNFNKCCHCNSGGFGGSEWIWIIIAIIVIICLCGDNNIFGGGNRCCDFDRDCDCC